MAARSARVCVRVRVMRLAMRVHIAYMLCVHARVRTFWAQRQFRAQDSAGSSIQVFLSLALACVDVCARLTWRSRVRFRRLACWRSLRKLVWQVGGLTLAIDIRKSCERARACYVSATVLHMHTTLALLAAEADDDDDDTTSHARTDSILRRVRECVCVRVCMCASLCVRARARVGSE